MGGRISELLDTIYSAGYDPTLWPQFLEKAGNLLGEAVTLHLQGYDLATNTDLGLQTHNFDLAQMDPYLNYYQDLNPWLPLIGSVKVGSIINDYEVIHRNDLKRTEFWADFVRPMDDISAGTGVVLKREKDSLLAFTANYNWKAQEHNRELVNHVFDEIAPHMQRAFRIGQLIEGHSLTSKTYQQVISRLKTPIFLVNHYGRTQFFNEQASNLAKEGSVLRLVQQGRIEFCDMSASRDFMRMLWLINNANPDSLGAFWASNVESGERVAIKIAPFKIEQAEASFIQDFGNRHRPIAMLSIVDPNRKHSEPIDVMARLYGVTPAETRLLDSLQNGLSLSEFSDLAQLSIHTVRNQMKSLFSKTGTKRQGELIALVNNFSV